MARSPSPQSAIYGASTSPPGHFSEPRPTTRAALNFDSTSKTRCAIQFLRSPVIDQNAVHRLLDLPACRYLGAWGDEQVAVYLLNPAQTAYCQSHLCFHPG